MKRDPKQTISIDSLIEYTRKVVLKGDQTILGRQIRAALFGHGKMELNQENLQKLAEMPMCFWEGVFFGRLSVTAAPPMEDDPTEIHHAIELLKTRRSTQ